MKKKDALIAELDQMSDLDSDPNVKVIDNVRDQKFNRKAGRASVYKGVSKNGHKWQVS